MPDLVSDSVDRTESRLPFTKEKPAAQTTNQIIGKRRWWALGAVLLTMFFSSLDQTVIATAMPVITGELQGFSLYAWTFTAYMLTSAVSVPIYGKLSDVYGRKPFYVIGLLLFMFGSMASGLVVNMPQLILARSLQGLGAGAMLSMPRATIGDIFNPRERGRWMGVIASVFGLASIIGPITGGWITDHWGWRWIFYINLPVAAVALAAVLYALPTVRTGRRFKLDWQGSLLLIAGLVPLLLAFTWAGVRNPWSSLPILGLFTIAIIFLGLFLWVERRAEEPIIAPYLFSNQIFTSTALISLFVAMSMFGLIIFLPVFMQGVLGQSAQQAGQMLTSMILSFIVASIIGGQLITRTGKYKLQATGGTLLLVISTFLLTQMNPDTLPSTMIRNISLTGVAIGLVLPLLNVAVQNAFPYREMGMVSASQQFIRSLGGIITAPILGSVMVSVFATELAAYTPASLQTAIDQLPPVERQALVDPQGLINADSQAAIQASFAQFGDRADILYQQFIDAVHQALSTGMTRLFILSLGFSILAFLATFLLKEIPLRQDEFYQGE